jgi:DNA replication and repair protein RecF
VLAVGPNGAGKTNLLEALHVGSQGFSPRTRADAHLVRFGEEAALVRLSGSNGAVPLELAVVIRAGGGKEARLNGARVPSAERLRAKTTTLVFTPDRLTIVKGPPAVRRAYFDRALSRVLPAQAASPLEYAEALGQRNAALRRVAAGLAPREALAPWTLRVAELAEALVGARREAVRLLSEAFAARAEGLGLAGGALAYEGRAPSVEELEARLARDLERGTTGLGPHLDDVRILAGARDLRTFGSQGEQRLAVLSLVLGEADLLASRRSAPALLLLDDVLSELDGHRRAALAAGLPPGSQTLVTATDAAALPGEPAQFLVVEPGAVRAA